MPNPYQSLMPAPPGLRMRDLTFKVKSVSPTAQIVENERAAVITTRQFLAGAIVWNGFEEDYTIGFIQQVDLETCEQTYCDRSTGKERALVYSAYAVPLPVRDNDNPNAPWYDDDGARRLTQKYKRATVQMSDGPDATVTWHEPRADGTLDFQGVLTHVIRSAKFTTWLVGRCESTQAATVLKKINWVLSWEANVDVTKPLKMRCRLILGNERPPTVTDRKPGDTVPAGVLSGPCTGTASQLWRTPLPLGSGTPMLITERDLRTESTAKIPAPDWIDGLDNAVEFADGNSEGIG